MTLIVSLVVHISPAAGVRLVGALFAGAAPGTTNGGTAQDHGAGDTRQLTFTHVCLQLREAWTQPIVCRQRAERNRSVIAIKTFPQKVTT